MSKRIISALFCFVMCLSLFSMSAYAGIIGTDDIAPQRTYEFYIRATNEPVNAQILENGDKLRMPATPKYEDYVFVCWTDED